MITVFDAETTGLPDFKARSSDPKQPHLVQLAVVTFTDDGADLPNECVIIKPDGWIIPPETVAIHGITQERAMDEGVREEDAVALFLMGIGRASTRVAHNISFDDRIMRIAMTRAGLDRGFIEAMEARDKYCTCNSAKPIVNLPPTDRMMAVGMNGPKPPSLIECMKHLFGEELPGAHDALVDARACAKIFFHIKSLSQALK